MKLDEKETLTSLKVEVQIAGQAGTAMIKNSSNNNNNNNDNL